MHRSTFASAYIIDLAARDGCAFLHDRSTHGTWLVAQSSEMFVHRETVHLMGRGVLWFGRRPSADRSVAVHYAVEQAF
ncbi:MAG: hypothetical protein HOI95_17805 [Chromatiales bacterium]|jgi:hypothetical protein|nr:hypothetical protein [Chromatiales bacterium]